jgi:hypothetical protein
LLFEKANLVGRPGVNIGTAPELFAFLVVQDDPLAHAGGADGDDGRRGYSGLMAGVPDTTAKQLPVVNDIEFHRVRVPGIAFMRPLFLAHRHLVSANVEQNSSTASRSRIDGKKIAGFLYHNIPPRLIFKVKIQGLDFDNSIPYQKINVNTFISLNNICLNMKI